MNCTTCKQLLLEAKLCPKCNGQRSRLHEGYKIDCIKLCNCLPCTKCKKQVPNRYMGSKQFCQQENACRKCCSCHRCPRCDSRLLDVQPVNQPACARCTYCRMCCRCRTIPFFEPSVPHFHKASLKDFKKSTMERYTSAEIEVCGVEGYGQEVGKVVKTWHGAIVFDRSVGEEGFEINTAPANGDLYVKQVDAICKVLKEQQAWIDERAGLHVHVNTEDVTFYDLRRVLFLYSRLEETLFRMLPAARMHSKYCMPCGKPYRAGLVEAVTPKANRAQIITNVYGAENDLYGSFVKDTRGLRRNRRVRPARYMALNIHSWFYRNTIEFRMHEGTLDPQEIINWTTLCAGIIDLALASKERDLVRSRKPAVKILESIMPSAKQKEWVHERLLKFAGEHTSSKKNFLKPRRRPVAGILGNVAQEAGYIGGPAATRFNIDWANVRAQMQQQAQMQNQMQVHQIGHVRLVDAGLGQGWTLNNEALGTTMGETAAPEAQQFGEVVDFNDDF